MMTVAAAVFVMVVLGGVTRLTRSGLSIVEWRPEGSWLPSTEAEWAVEFEKYKQFPEYHMVNRNMTLEEFKPIYFMEWFHRMWGRGLGVLFAVPFLGFALTRSIPAALFRPLGLAFALGGLQGAVGWWMVKSGLDEQKIKEHFTPTPRVSPYRLTAHLTMAFGIFSVLFWSALNAFAGARATAGAVALRNHLGPLDPARVLSAVKRLRGPSAAVLAIVGTTAFSGAFVAGNDAGHAYNDWPFFAGAWIPEQIWFEKLGWKNFFENTATVQFDHRMLAYASVAAIAAMHTRWGAQRLVRDLPTRVNQAMRGVGYAMIAQVALGISTLMLYVPIPLAAAHQGGAMILWSTALWVRHALREAATDATAASAHKVTTAAAEAIGTMGASAAADAKAATTVNAGTPVARSITALALLTAGSGDVKSTSMRGAAMDRLRSGIAASTATPGQQWLLARRP